METAVCRIRCGTVNCYLLMENDKQILVDTGPGDRKALLRGLARYGVAPGALGLVLLTHNHADHTGCAGYFQARGIPVAAHPSDCPLPGALHARGLAGGLLRTLSGPMVRRQEPLRPDLPLEDGMSLAPYGISATVLPLPGHTAGSVGVLLEDGSLICGDTFMRFLSPSPAHIAEDFALLDKTVNLLHRRGVTTIYPGHGKPWTENKK